MREPNPPNPRNVAMATLGAGAGAGTASTAALDDDEARFEELEAEFGQVLLSLSGDRSLERFHAEYDKIFGALRKVRDGGRPAAPAPPLARLLLAPQSHENERRLYKKVKELNNEIVVNGASRAGRRTRARALAAAAAHANRSCRAHPPQLPR